MPKFRFKFRKDRVSPGGGRAGRVRGEGDSLPVEIQQYVSGRRRLLELAALALGGLVLAAAYPPFDFGGAAWLAPAPLFLAPPRRRWRSVFFEGFIFGAAFFLVSLFWLVTVTWVGWFFLALACACFPGVWRLGMAPLLRRLHLRAGSGERGDGRRPSGWLGAGLVFWGAVLWVALEWVRAHIFSGFPWNLVGVSLWRSDFVRDLAAFTGVYGGSALALAANAAFSSAVVRWVRNFRHGTPRGLPWDLAAGAGVLAGAALLAMHAPRLGRPDRVLRVAVVQGGLPQMREWSQKQLDEALRVYDRLTRDIAAAHPDLIVWPETAIPAPLRYDARYAGMMARLLADVPAEFLIGTIDYRPAVRSGTGVSAKTALPDVYNSAFLFDRRGRLVQVYDKIHPVPFGEYTPFESIWPWLSRWIGMGRGLTPGRRYTIFRLPHGVLAGVNICYEDVFPEISRAFVRRGATVLITITNDAWYAHSAGSRQHLIHAVFRAAEERRPLLRAGNNSDSCLVAADGRITGLLRDPQTGNRFVRGARVYRVPVWERPPLTFYARYGDIFAGVCVGLAGFWFGFLGVRLLWVRLERARRISEPRNR